MSSIPFKVIRVGIIQSPTHRHSVPATRSDDAMLRYFSAGKGYYCHHDQKTELAAGFCSLFPPHTPGITICDQHDPYMYYYCRFTGTYALTLVNQINERRGTIFQVPDEAQLVDIFRRMFEIYPGPLPPERRDMPMTRLDAMLALLLTSLAESDNGPRTANLSGVILQNYLHDHLSDPTDLETIAQDLGVSKSTLVRQARKLLGKTILKAHEEMKMNWAQTLLASEQLSIADVAAHVGYRDPLYFSQVFRKHFGVSPSRWRQENLRQTPPQER
ncbi:MAG: AraC family transcriptional regulator [Lentisphaerae bacterium]|nr:MAG: AraC family transcriptional regulator [Lentisphaerota bacterium]